MSKLFRLFFTLVVTIIVFWVISIIPNISNYAPEVYAASPDEIKNYIRERVDDQSISIPPKWESDSFGKFLWGLAGCESTWNERNVSPDGLFQGLYQYHSGTWQNVNTAMGISPTPDIYNGFAQIDATIYIIQTGYNNGFNNWPGCTDGIGREWTGFTDGWPAPPPQSGDIIVTKSAFDPLFSGARKLNTWVNDGARTGANSAVFSGLSSEGTYKVHVLSGGLDASTLRYTLCNSTEEGCVRTTCDPFDSSCNSPLNKYHKDDKLRDVEKITSTEAVVTVKVPPGGFVDIMFHYFCTGQGCLTAQKPTLKIPFIGDVEASHTRTVFAPPRVFVTNLGNLPGCSDSLYGGTSFGDSRNVQTRFQFHHATKVEFEAYANGNRFYNSLNDDGAWQSLVTHSVYQLSVNFWNLSPDTNYNWRVRSGNEAGWSSWVAGSWWNVPPCSVPSNPTGFTISNVPSCSKTGYQVDTSWGISGVVTKTQMKLIARDWNGNKIGEWLIGDWDYAVVGATIINLWPGRNYEWSVRVGNSVGWSSWVAGPKWKAPFCGVELTITSFTVNKQTYGYYESGTATVTVQNLGNKNAGSFIVKFFLSANYPPCSADTPYKTTVSSLAAGAVTTVNLAFQNGEGTKDYQAWAHADGNCQITETNEFNNYATANFRVDDKSDLVFSNYLGDTKVDTIKCASSGGSICNPGEEVSMTLVLRNVKGSVVGGFSVDIFRDLKNTFEENQKLTCNNTIYTKRLTQVKPGYDFAIGPGGTVPFITTFTAPQSPGNYTARALVDSSTSTSPAPGYCYIDESIEENNATAANYSVVIPTTDADGDGFTDYSEKLIGTDPNKSCGTNAWPPDINDNGLVAIDDVNFVSSRFNAKEGDANYTKRAELATQNGVIGIDDVNAATSRFNQTCSP